MRYNGELQQRWPAKRPGRIRQERSANHSGWSAPRSQGLVRWEVPSGTARQSSWLARLPMAGASPERLLTIGALRGPFQNVPSTILPAEDLERFLRTGGFRESNISEIIFFKFQKKNNISKTNFDISEK